MLQHIRSSKFVHQSLKFDSTESHSALEQFSKALEITDETFGKGHIKTESARFNVDTSYLFLRNHDEVLKHYKLALNIYVEKLCQSHQETGLFIAGAMGLIKVGLYVTKEQVVHHRDVKDGNINPLYRNYLRKIGG